MNNIDLYKDKVERVLADILKLAGEEAELACSVAEGTILIDISSKEPARLIGRGGKGLEALQYIVQRIVVKGGAATQMPRIVIDIEGYRKKRQEELSRMSKDIAERVSVTGRSVLLEPMNAWERRAIHMAIRDNDKVDTASEETEEGRQVRIKPKENRRSLPRISEGEE